jgi:hypothetical protein
MLFQTLLPDFVRENHTGNAIVQSFIFFHWITKLFHADQVSLDGNPKLFSPFKLLLGLLARLAKQVGVTKLINDAVETSLVVSDGCLNEIRFESFESSFVVVPHSRKLIHDFVVVKILAQRNFVLAAIFGDRLLVFP